MVRSPCQMKLYVNSISRYNPIQKFGPQDCISSINGIIEKIDHLVATENEFVINRLKALFGLEAVVDIRDFAQTIAFPRECHYPLDEPYS